MEPAPYQNNIIWDGLNFDKATGQIVNLIQFMLLLFVSLVIVTPVSLF